MSDRQKISVITVVLNAAEAFSRTADSILSQDYPDIEWIVIDGGSADGTLEQVKALDEKIAHWISEPDRGIFDAMNKGLKLATGEWVNFMNAGDTYTDSSSVSNAFSSMKGEAEVVYGDCIVRYPDIDRTLVAGKPSDLPARMAFCHQAVFVRTTLARVAGFDLQYPIGADYRMMLGLYSAGHRFVHVARPLIYYDNSGASSRRMLASAVEHYRIARNSNLLSARASIRHISFILWMALLTFIYRIFPENMTHSIRNLLFSLTGQTKKR